MSFRIAERMEEYRLRHGDYASRPRDPFGAFLMPGPKGSALTILASDGNDDTISADMRNWEHVSVSTERRLPNWEEMCFVKKLFWEDGDVVVQFHPRLNEYVNYHPRVLHMWRHRHLPFPTPPTILVGPKC